MKAEANTITGTAPGQNTKLKGTKKAAATKSRIAATKSGKAKAGAKKAKAAKSPKSEGVTKTTTVLELLRRKEGATIADIAKATGWQNHSIRGFLSGTIGKKMALTLNSVKNKAGDRTYRLE